MTEQELRALIRGVIAEQIRLKPDVTSQWFPPSGGPEVREHASHALFVIPAQGDACIIEPGVTCTHCGYCKSYGH